MGNKSGRRQRGFTLVELLAVMAILGILAGLVGGTVVGLGARSQSTRLDGDRDIIRKAANSFFLEAFPEAYPVEAITNTQLAELSTDLGVRVIDFKKGLPQDPAKKFVPNFLTELPDSSALVSWRIDTNSGNVFFAQDGSPLIKPSNNRLDISATVGTPDTQSDYSLKLSEAKNESALETLRIKIPAGYSVGGQFAPKNSVVGVLSATLDTDNEVDSGQTIHFGGVLVTTAVVNQWALVVDYNDNASTSGKCVAATPCAVKTAAEAVRVHKVSIVAPSSDSAGTLTLEMSRGTDSAANKATEIWTLTLLGKVTQTLSAAELTVPSGATAAAGSGLLSTARTFNDQLGKLVGFRLLPNAGTSISETLITNPKKAAVYRWLAEEHGSIDPVVGESKFFSDVPGSQGVLIK